MLCSLVHVSTNNFLISLSEILTCQHVCNFSTFEPTNCLHTLNYHLFQPLMINLTNENVYDVKQLVEPPTHEFITFSNSWAVITLATMGVTSTVLSIVSIFQFKSMHIQILKQPYCAYLYVHHQGFSTLVPQTYDADDILELKFLYKIINVPISLLGSNMQTCLIWLILYIMYLHVTFMFCWYIFFFSS